MSRRTYLLSPRFLSIYVHEALLIRKSALKQWTLSHWTFLTTYEDVVAALLDDSQVTFSRSGQWTTLPGKSAQGMNLHV